MILEIDQIKITKRYRKDLGNLEQLAGSISVVGLLHPPVLNSKHELIAGFRRIEACKLLGWKRIPVTISKNGHETQSQADENNQRKPFTPSEAVAIAEKLRPKVLEAAKQRHKEGSKLGNEVQRGRRGSPKFRERRRSLETESVLGQSVGMSGTTYTRARAVVLRASDPTLSEGDRERAREAVEIMDSTGKVNTAYQRSVGHQSPPPSKKPLRSKARAQKGFLESMNTLAGMMPGLAEIDTQQVTLSESDKESWIKVITQSISVLSTLRNELKDQSS